MKAKTADRPAAKKVTEPQPPKVIRLRLPRNYTWTGNGYVIRERAR